MQTPLRSGWVLLAPLLLLAACGKTGGDAPQLETAALASTAAVAPVAAEIDWREDQVDEAFIEAGEKDKPVLLYWGARWCPPCNQLKATVFKRPDFVEQTRHFVAVHLDGDSPGAQRWGDHFGIAGYPTLIVLRKDRTEMMRMSGGTDVEQFPKILALALRQTSSAAELRDRALKAPQELSVDDWTLLANYGWEVDQDRLSGAGQGAQLLHKLAAACPVESLRPRFAMIALSAAANQADKAEDALPADQRAAAQSLLLSVMQDPAQARASHGELTYTGAAMIAAASPPNSEARRRLADALPPAMDRFHADASLPVLDRLLAVNAEIELSQLQHGEKAALPQALIDKVHSRVVWADQQSKTPFERQAVISDAAQLLEAVGDRSGAEKLLLAELPKSQTPYYYMPHLSDLAAQRGDSQQAVDWLRRAYETSDGPATRTQWGVSYVRGLIELTPKDTKAIEAAMSGIIDEVAAHPDAYYQRTRGRFDKLAAVLKAWSESNGQAEVLQRLRTHMDAVCAKLPASSESLRSCQGWLSQA